MLCVCIAHEAGGRKESNIKKLRSIYASLNYLKIKCVAKFETEPYCIDFILGWKLAVWGRVRHVSQSPALFPFNLCKIEKERKDYPAAKISFFPLCPLPIILSKHKPDFFSYRRTHAVLPPHMKASQSETDFQIIVECFIIWKSYVLRVLFFNLRNGSSCKKGGERGI